VSAQKVNTVLGPISPSEMGVTLPHEHIVFGFPGWEGDQTIAPFDREGILSRALELMEELKALGLRTFVDATPNDGGRFPDLLREVSEKSGVNIICSTGYYYEEEGMPAYWKFRSSMGDVSGEIYELFSKEITEGIRDTGIKAGAIKVGTGKGEITDYERMMFEVAARVQKDTGVPIITHTQEGTMGPEQAELLVAAGAEPKRIQIGHMSDNTDIHYHLETLKHGVNISFDRMGLQVVAGCPMDVERYAVLIGLIGRTVRRSHRPDRNRPRRQDHDLPRHHRAMARQTPELPGGGPALHRRLASDPPVQEGDPRPEERRRNRRADSGHPGRQSAQVVRRRLTACPRSADPQARKRL